MAHRKSEILDLIENGSRIPKSIDELWYLVDRFFIDSLSSGTDNDTGDDITIHNRPLLQEQPLDDVKEVSTRAVLRTDKLNSRFYELVDARTWRQLDDMGVTYDVAIPRQVYLSAIDYLKVDVQPLSIWVLKRHVSGEPSVSFPSHFRIAVCRNDLSNVLTEQIAKELSIPMNNIRLFVGDVSTRLLRVNFDGEQNLCDECEVPPLISDIQDWQPIGGNVLTFDENSVIAVETRESPGHRQSASRIALNLSMDNCSTPPLQFPAFSTPGLSVEKALATGGFVGLQNLGNTCFMNSGLQCLSRILPLTQYFLTEEYKNDLNYNNPLGMQGKLAIEYARFLFVVWNVNQRNEDAFGNFQTISPSKLKQTVGRFAPQFIGYQQQDSQEFLAFFLDGLHEDLNRIRKKPYIEVS